MLPAFDFLARWLRSRFAGKERGAALVEYALLMALIALICIASVKVVGGAANTMFHNVGTAIANAT